MSAVLVKEEIEKVPEADYHVVRYSVACWLRYYKQCHLVSFERGGTSYVWENPDVFAVNAKRQTFDVEIKVSFSDFKADMRKRKHDPRFAHYKRPTWFYYAAPMKLAEKIHSSGILPNGAGVLGVREYRDFGQHAVEVLEAAKKFDGKKTSILTVAKWVKDQSGTLCRMAQLIARPPSGR